MLVAKRHAWGAKRGRETEKKSARGSQVLTKRSGLEIHIIYGVDGASSKVLPDDRPEEEARQ